MWKCKASNRKSHHCLGFGRRLLQHSNVQDLHQDPLCFLLGNRHPGRPGTGLLRLRQDSGRRQLILGRPRLASLALCHLHHCCSVRRLHSWHSASSGRGLSQRHSASEHRPDLRGFHGDGRGQRYAVPIHDRCDALSRTLLLLRGHHVGGLLLGHLHDSGQPRSQPFESRGEFCRQEQEERSADHFKWSLRILKWILLNIYESEY